MQKKKKSKKEKTKDAIAFAFLVVAVVVVSTLYLVGFLREMRGKSKALDWKEYVHVKGQIQPALKVAPKAAEAH